MNYFEALAPHAAKIQAYKNDYLVHDKKRLESAVNKNGAYPILWAMRDSGSNLIILDCNNPDYDTAKSIEFAEVFFFRPNTEFFHGYYNGGQPRIVSVPKSAAMGIWLTYLRAIKMETTL